MKFALIQSNLVWENKAANLSNFTKLLEDIHSDTDIVMLPEMFNTGFSMNIALAESMVSEAVTWLKHQSKIRRQMICGSAMIAEDNKVYNRFIASFEGEIIHIYDKRHLFRMAGEHEWFNPGSDRRSFDFKGWRIRPNICYDLRFPVWSRNDDDFDIYLNVANWPDRRRHHWEALLAARAIENQCYAIGVNRVGEDGKGIFYSGGTSVYDFNGIAQIQSSQEEILYIEISKEPLLQIRAEFPVAADRDSFQVNDDLNR